MKQLNRGAWAEKGFLKAPRSDDFSWKKKVIKLIFNRAAKKKINPKNQTEP